MSILDIINQLSLREYIYLLSIFGIFFLVLFLTIKYQTKSWKKGIFKALTLFIPLVIFSVSYFLTRWRIDSTSYAMYQVVFFILLLIHTSLVILISQIEEFKTILLSLLTFISLLIPPFVFFTSIRVPLLLFVVDLIINTGIILLISKKQFSK
jgi:hypothetical protein